MTAPQPDLLGRITAVPRRPASDLLVAVTAVAAVAVAGAGIAAAAVLGSSGAQPESVLPATTVAVLKVDLDPAADQKVAAYKLGRRFPDLNLRGEDSVVSDLVRQAVEGSIGVDYAKDVEPWLGDRVAVAAVPVEGEARPLLALQVGDRAAAATALRRLAEDESFGFAFVGDDYVLLAETQAEVTAAAGAEDHLDDTSEYSDAVGELEGNQVVTAWADLSGAYAAAPDELRGDQAPSGYVVAGLRVDESYVEITGKALDVQGEPTTAGREPTQLVRRLPDDAVAAMGISGLADGLRKAIEDGPLAPLLDQAEGDLGIDVADDLPAIVGEDLAVAVLPGDAPGFAARSRTSAGDQGLAALQELLGQTMFGGSPDGAAQARSLVRRTSDGLVAGSDAAAVDRVAEDGALGSTALFRKAVPDAEDAGVVLYIDVQRALALADGVDMAEQAKAVEAVGMSASASEDGNGSFRLRVTFR